MRARPPILAKLTPPTLPAVLPRPRLFRLLDRARQRPFVWITAPAGAGKTTVVASYLKARRLPVLWYRLDESDADSASFFHHLSRAATMLAPKYRKPLPVLTPEYSMGRSTFARRYVQALGARLPRRCILVLDNYQELPSQSGLQTMLADGLDELPAGMSAMVISRQGISAPWVRAQAEQRMVWIGPDQVHLSKAESAGIVRLHLRPLKRRVAQTLINEIHERVGGWAAGLMLLLEQIKQQNAMVPASVGETAESVFHYLATHVLQQFDDEVQVILLKASILSDMSVQLAERVTNSSRAGEVLRSLYSTRCFIERRHSAEPWYRYHPLFREFLLQQLVTRYSKREVQELRRQAAIYLAEAGQHEESIELLRLAEDWMAMGRQVSALAPVMLGQGRLATVDSWISSIPSEVVNGEAWLQFWLACSRMFLSPTEAQILFGKAFEQFLARQEQAGVLLAWTNLVRCILFQWSGLPRLDFWIDRFATIHPEGTPYPSPEIEAQVAEAMAGALVWRRPANPETGYWLETAISLSDRLAGSGAGHAIFLTESYLVWLGNLVEARKGQNRLLERASKPNAPPSLKILYCLSDALLGSIESRVEDCRRAVREGLALAEREGIHVWDGWLVAQEIHNCLFAGELNAAEGWMGKVAPVWERVGGLYRCQLQYLSTWSKILAGEWEQAMVSGLQALTICEQEGGPFPEALCCTLVAAACQSSGHHQQAEIYRERACAIGEAMNSDFLRYGTGWLTAQFAFEAGDRTKGLEALRQTLAIGRKRGLSGYVGWQAQLIARLCATALEEDIEVPFVQGLIRRTWLPIPPEERPANWPWAVKISVLGGLRIEVGGQPLVKQRKAPHRLLELLAAIVAFGGVDVPVARVTDALWPEADGDQAQENFKKSVARLRKLLVVDDAILWQEGNVSLNPELCWVDAVAFEARLKQDDRGEAMDGAHGRLPVPQAVGRYLGAFLGSHDIPVWAIPYQAHLRNQWVIRVLRQNEHIFAKAGLDDAVRDLDHAIRIDPMAEPLHRRLISLLLKNDRRAEAAVCFDRCQTEMARAGRSSSAELQELARTILSR